MTKNVDGPRACFAELLLPTRQKVHGTKRRTSLFNTAPYRSVIWILASRIQRSACTMVSICIVGQVQPDQIYNLLAQKPHSRLIR
ncbi:hypothetical protein DAA51_36770 [Bradyrhizobium sp. WBAH10]|nr:hypothetical protein [Bradyrhizobium sp. WBAH30]MDD1543447.1 hypothetical protein [Bradyrhizobium sp. WBAH41]MDD1557577.1 hypothetical protein [Bradyrhizobium sp. WBAH23]MDD1564989.1 hypothetical protein [Bradyrhizobium sp. WBAH33]MDD1590397.1 hypothetical protein [Bradyrhizobium sp. WBAH42]NRB88104.1 hypothetical protein [Bradyrhizobium sp. WBAH10]QCJ93433.1 hypothetical protein DAA57_37015 [Bradyrhizobium yuanmingense]